MNIEIIPGTTEITDIATTIRTKLKIDNDSEIDIRVTEELSDLDDDDKSDRDLRVTIENYENYVTIMQPAELDEFINSITNFVEENFDEIMKR